MSLAKLGNLRFALISVVVSACLCACVNDLGSSGAASSPSAVAPHYPSGFLSSAVGVAAIRDVYPSDGTFCCWAGPKAKFYAEADPTADQIVMVVVVPAIGPLTKYAGEIALLDAHGKAIGKHSLHGGGQSLTFPLPKGSVKNGYAPISIVDKQSFVPKEGGYNGDPRRLSFVLMSVKTLTKQ